MATSVSTNPGSASSTHFSADSLADKLARNSKALMIFGAGLVAVVAIGALMMSQRQNKAEEANSALFAARTALNKELTTLAKADMPASAKPAAPTPKDAKNPTPPPAEPDPDSVAFKKLDVDATLKDGVGQLQGVVQKYEGTRAAHEAKVQLGDLYFQHGQADKAAPWFEQAVKSAPSSNEKALALRSHGYALEGAGKHKEAADAFEKSVGQKLDVIKGDALLGLARNLVAQNDTAKAKATYDRILAELPNTEYARTAERLKSTLPQ